MKLQCPLSDFWQNVILDMKVEVVNNDTCLTSSKVYWIASVVKVAGTVTHLNRLTVVLSSVSSLYVTL